MDLLHLWCLLRALDSWVKAVGTEVPFLRFAFSAWGFVFS